MRTFCTIITTNYLAYAITLYRSISSFNHKEKFYVLIVDNGPLTLPTDHYPGFQILKLNDLSDQHMVDKMYLKYSERTNDAFRWSLKPLLILHLLNRGYEQVIYTDCDLFFFHDYSLLFDELAEAGVLLSPCWRTINHELSEPEFIALYTDGLYNAGFIGATKNGIAAIRWWAHACSYKIEINHDQGLFVDQKYLDALPVMFENIKILRHKGCNVAFWNQHVCKRVKKGDEVWINGVDRVIFMHLTNHYISELIEGQDPLMFPYYQKYEQSFSESGKSLRDFIIDLPDYVRPGKILQFKRKIMLRTRLKNIISSWLK